MEAAKGINPEITTEVNEKVKAITSPMNYALVPYQV